MRFVYTIVWFLIFTKLFLFWLWLWQLKNYHFGRFRAHFEAQKIKKIASSIWRLKLPKFTKKIIVIFLSGILLQAGMFYFIFNFSDLYFKLFILAFFILSPIIFGLLIMFFQIPTVILRNRILKKAGNKREKFKDLIVIGITGSYGKTSTKECLSEILSKKFKVLKTKENLNAEIGIAKAILQELDQTHQVFVAEIGAYNKGKIKQVCKMLKPKIGILTGINEQHMATFGSQEDIIKAKFELIEVLPKDGLAVFNGNNQHCRNLFEKTKIPKKLISSQKDFEINFEMAKVVSQELGVGESEIPSVCSSPLQAKKRKLSNGIEINVIDSSYSSNPTGVISHLNYLKNNFEGKKRIVIMPCIIELGKSSKKVHYTIGQTIAKTCDLAIITTKDRFKQIKLGVLSAGMPADHILLIENPADIAKKIVANVSVDDIILLEGRISQKTIDELK